MEFEDSREEWGGFDLNTTHDMNILHGTVKLLGISNRKLSLRFAYNAWKEKYYTSLVHRSMQSLKKIDPHLPDLAASTTTMTISQILGHIRYSIQALLQKNNQIQLEKQKWLINKKKISICKDLENFKFAEPIIERINFWKQSLFPGVETDKFWNIIENLHPGLKLNILETEIINEHNEIEKNKDILNSKINKYSGIEKKINKREAELVFYQEFLKKQCLEVQKHWNEIGKVGGDLRDFNNIGELANKNLQNMAVILNIFSDPSFPDLSSSRIDLKNSFSDSLDLVEEKRSHMNDPYQYNLDIPTKLKKNAVRTIVTKLKSLTESMKKESLTVWQSVIYHSTDKDVKISREKSQLFKKPKYYSRRHVEFEQNTLFQKEKKHLKVVYAKLIKLAANNWKTVKSLQKKHSFTLWKLKSIKETIKEKPRLKKNQVFNHLSLKIIFLLIVILSRSIIDCKKLLVFRTWTWIQASKNNKILKTELINIEKKINENIARENGNKLEAAIGLEKLKSKLYILESQIKLLKLQN